MSILLSLFLPHRGLNPQSTTFEASTLPITPLMMFEKLE